MRWGLIAVACLLLTTASRAGDEYIVRVESVGIRYDSRLRLVERDLLRESAVVEIVCRPGEPFIGGGKADWGAYEFEGTLSADSLPTRATFSDTRIALTDYASLNNEFFLGNDSLEIDGDVFQRSAGTTWREDHPTVYEFQLHLFSVALRPLNEREEAVRERTLAWQQQRLVDEFIRNFEKDKRIGSRRR